MALERCFRFESLQKLDNIDLGRRDRNGLSREGIRERRSFLALHPKRIEGLWKKIDGLEKEKKEQKSYGGMGKDLMKKIGERGSSEKSRMQEKIGK